MRSFYSVSETKILKTRSKYSKEILALFIQLYPNYIYQRREARRPNSNLIKYNMVKLGHKLGFRVYANGLTEEQFEEQKISHGFLNREFLYDIHWYNDKKGMFYMPEKISLVAESELGDRRKGDFSKLKNAAVMFDFQKLLVANAELRLMIFKVKRISELDTLNEYFEKSIESYKLLSKKSAFLFICFVHEIKAICYSEKFKE